ncbi:MAG: metallophosphoesterase [Verrucomicrobiota bacterium]|nr:metallophosphoesterase [Verrucomicrobiota bacterium]
MKKNLRIIIILCSLSLTFAKYLYAVNNEKQNKKEPWSIVLIPDTQAYVYNSKNAIIFTEITKWISTNKKKENIKLVLHLGDITYYNSPKEWNNAQKSMFVLNNELPYIMCIGNHDIGNGGKSQTRTTLFNEYFKITNNKLNEKLLVETYEKGKLENACFTFSQAGKKYLLLTLEFAPRDKVIDWADKMAKQYSNHEIILITHEFIDEHSQVLSKNKIPLRSSDNTPGNAKRYNLNNHKGGVNNGNNIWNKLILKNKNFILIANGHYMSWEKTAGGELKKLPYIASAHRSDKISGGKTVHQLLFNAQWIPNGGDGWVQILTFYPKQKKIKVRTFSPYLQKKEVKCELDEKDFKFELKMD